MAKEDYPTLGQILRELQLLRDNGTIEGGSTRIKGGGKFSFNRGRNMNLLNWPGVGDFWLNKDQAQVVSVLIEAFFESKVPDVSQKVLLQTIKSKEAHLAAVFKDSEAWGALVVPGKAPGTYRIAASKPERFVDDDDLDEGAAPDEDWME